MQLLVTKFLCKQHERIIMLKHKTTEYVFGVITGMSIMLAIWACTSNPLNASYTGNVQEVKVVNYSWEPVNVKIIE